MLTGIGEQFISVSEEYLASPGLSTVYLMTDVMILVWNIVVYLLSLDLIDSNKFDNSSTVVKTYVGAALLT